MTCNLQVVLARTRPGMVVGPDGRPLAGASIAGLLGLYDEPRTQVTSDFTAEALDPSRPHYLLARHDGASSRERALPRAKRRSRSP